MSGPLRTRADLIAFADGSLAAVAPHVSPGGAQIVLPGTPGGYGTVVDGLEGFARTFLLAAMRLAAEPADPAGLAERYARGLTTGTDPSAVEAWVCPSEHGQAKVEAASLALDWSREQVWDKLSPTAQHQVIDYLAEVVGNRSYPRCNWLWFQIVTETFLHSVGGPVEEADITTDLEVLDSFYAGQGWYRDGEAAPGWAVNTTGADGIVRVANHGTDHALPGSNRADSPLYARIGYSTATAPLLDAPSWIAPVDQSVVLVDAAGRRSHRTGMSTVTALEAGGWAVAHDAGVRADAAAGVLTLTGTRCQAVLSGPAGAELRVDHRDQASPLGAHAATAVATLPARTGWAWVTLALTGTPTGQVSSAVDHPTVRLASDRAEIDWLGGARSTVPLAGLAPPAGGGP